MEEISELIKHFPGQKGEETIEIIEGDAEEVVVDLEAEEEIEETETGTVEIGMTKKEVRKEERVLVQVLLREEDHHLHPLLQEETSLNLLPLLVLIIQRAEEAVEAQNQKIQINPTNLKNRNQSPNRSQNLSQKIQRVKTLNLNKRNVYYILKYV